MSPEALWRLPHGPSTDFYALGVLLHEIIFRVRPYRGTTKSELKEVILQKEAFIDSTDTPKGWSKDAIDFVN
jgi:serine/threonine protein kinase